MENCKVNCWNVWNRRESKDWKIRWIWLEVAKRIIDEILKSKRSKTVDSKIHSEGSFEVARSKRVEIVGNIKNNLSGLGGIKPKIVKWLKRETSKVQLLRETVLKFGMSSTFLYNKTRSGRLAVIAQWETFWLCRTQHFFGKVKILKAVLRFESLPDYKK